MMKINNLTVTYGDGTKAVDTVSFTINTGENVALIGANGAGKTSLLLSLVGVLYPAAGEVSLPGLTLGKKTLREIRSRVGMAFQNPDDQLFMPNIYEDVAFGPRSFGLSESDVKKRADSALSKLGILALAERSPLKLSGGEKRLAAIATILALSPDYILFDEPTAYLDPRSRRNLTAAIHALPQGKLIATHDLPFAETVCSRVLLMQNGKLAADGGIEILRDSAALEAAGL